MPTARVTSIKFKLNEAGLVEQARPIMRRSHSSLQRATANEGRLRVPVRTGNLGRSIREDEQHWTGPLFIRGGVTAHADYAVFVHEGTRPHVIRGKNGGYLSFNWAKAGGRRVVFRSVNHPGTRPRPFLRNALEHVAATHPLLH